MSIKTDEHMDNELYELINNGHFSDARRILYKYIPKYQNNEKFVILFILFKISDAEKVSGEDNILCSPAACKGAATGRADSLVKHYTRIKFYLRRYEYNMPDEALEEAIAYFIENKVSATALYKIAGFACIDKIPVYAKLAHSYRKKGMFPQAAAFENIREERGR